VGLEQALHCFGYGHPIGTTGQPDPDADRTILGQLDFGPLDPLNCG
jgi:hypothetical protein